MKQEEFYLRNIDGGKLMIKVNLCGQISALHLDRSLLFENPKYQVFKAKLERIKIQGLLNESTIILYNWYINSKSFSYQHFERIAFLEVNNFIY